MIKLCLMSMLVSLTSCIKIGGHIRDWETKKGTETTLQPLVEEFPFSVCLDGNFNSREEKKLKFAISELNNSLEQYVENKEIDKTLVPSSLFYISNEPDCKVQIKRESIREDQLGSTNWDISSSVHPIIYINGDKKFNIKKQNKRSKKPSLKTLFKHELMHSAGFGHLDESDLMNESVVPCFYKKCIMTDYEWEIFLSIYL